MKYHRFNDNFVHNYRRYKNKIKSSVKETPVDLMESMIEQYSTDIDNKKCNCGQADLLSAILKVKLPCIHLYYLKMPFPKIDPPSLDLTILLTGSMVFEYRI